MKMVGPKRWVSVKSRKLSALTLVLLLLCLAVLALYVWFVTQHVISMEQTLPIARAPSILAVVEEDTAHKTNSAPSYGLDAVDEHKKLSLGEEKQALPVAERASQKCSCVDCQEDELCGGLWRAMRYPGMDRDPHTLKIHLVVSHCKANLDWIANYTKGFDVASIHVVTKCGSAVNGAPESATIEVSPNVGRCDHTYAHYINSILDQKVVKGTDEESIVVFLKDDISPQNTHGIFSAGRISLEEIVRLASSANGFGCGIRLKDNLSEYHVPEMLEWNIKNYKRDTHNYTTGDQEQFVGFESFAAFRESLTSEPLPAVFQGCYGGVFAASVSNIKKTHASVWLKAEKLLSRGKNIQEGHFMERLWGSFLSTPLAKFQMDALLRLANAGRKIPMRKHYIKGDYFGALHRRPSRRTKRGGRVYKSK